MFEVGAQRFDRVAGCQPPAGVGSPCYFWAPLVIELWFLMTLRS